MNVKPVIAIDVDEVLADGAIDFINFSNQQWGTTLTIDDYTEHYSKMWQVDHEETERRAHAWHISGGIGKHAVKQGSVEVLTMLKDQYDLIVTTSRRDISRDVTIAWLQQHYPGVFTDIKFAGLFDNGVNAEAFARTKADIYREINADYAIDDQLKHCQAAVGQGMTAVLFGNYPWNQSDSLPLGVVRCDDWHAVGQYFDGL